MSFIADSWNGRQDVKRVVLFVYIPFTTVLIIMNVANYQRLLPVIFHLWKTGLFTNGIVNGLFLYLFTVAGWVLKSLWACAGHTNKWYHLAVARVIVAISSFLYIGLFGSMWLFSQSAIDEQICLAKAASINHIDEDQYVKAHYKEAWGVCVKGVGRFAP
jgi:hypothetical protein